MKLRNVDIKQALDDLTALCGGGNRIPDSLSAIRADRSRRACEAAWAPCEAERVRLIYEHGEPYGDPDPSTGQRAVRVLPGTPGWAAFAAAWNAVAAEEQDVPIQPIPLAAVRAGFYRDTEPVLGVKGPKEPLDISPEQLGRLVALGFVEEPSTNGDDAP